MEKKLFDDHGRRIRKLRVSLLDACNFRCFYCMPEKAKFMPSKNWMTADEIIRLSSLLKEFGLSQVRLTGGEPLLRSDCIEIAEKLSFMGFEKLGLTTNGYRLKESLEGLKNTDCKYLNVSLDSLNSKKFKSIVRLDAFDRVMSGILKAKELGFKVKINTVLMKGINENEVFDFLEFSKKYDLPVRFLEMMKIGQVNSLDDEMFISADEILKIIGKKEKVSVASMDFDSTSLNYTAGGAEFGVIASETKSFCGSCSRLRLSPSGDLRACLMSDRGENIRDLSDDEMYKALLRVLKLKPLERIEKIQQDMYQIGG